MEDTQTHSQPKWLRAKQIADKYGIALSTVWYWSSIGKISRPTAKLGARCSVWSEDVIDKDMKKLVTESTETEVSEVSNG